MVSPAGKKLSIGKDLDLSDLKKLLNVKPKKKSPRAAEVRKLGPGIEIPAIFLQAQDILLKKLVGDSTGTKSKALGSENILGMHIGQKLVKGKPTGSLAVVVTVRKKLKEASKIQARYRIPKRIKVGKQFVPVDVKLGYDIEPQAIGGDICGLNRSNVGPGSLGCFCFINLPAGHVDFLLTNNHVIGRFANGKPGDDLTDDDVFDSAGGAIAGGPLRCGTLDGGDGLSIDAAIAFSGENNPPENSNKHVALQFTGNIRVAEVGDIVIMHGAATRGTRGRVRRVLAFKDVPYTEYPINRHIKIRSVFEIQPLGSPEFSKGGDSGSVIIHEASGDPVGILIGGGTDGEGPFSLANDLTAIQADLHFSRHPQCAVIGFLVDISAFIVNGVYLNEEDRIRCHRRSAWRYAECGRLPLAAIPPSSSRRRSRGFGSAPRHRATPRSRAVSWRELGDDRSAAPGRRQSQVGAEESIRIVGVAESVAREIQPHSTDRQHERQQRGGSTQRAGASHNDCGSIGCGDQNPIRETTMKRVIFLTTTALLITALPADAQIIRRPFVQRVIRSPFVNELVNFGLQQFLPGFPQIPQLPPLESPSALLVDNSVKRNIETATSNLRDADDIMKGLLDRHKKADPKADDKASAKEDAFHALIQKGNNALAKDSLASLADAIAAFGEARTLKSNDLTAYTLFQEAVSRATIKKLADEFAAFKKGSPIVPQLAEVGIEKNDAEMTLEKKGKKDLTIKLSAPAPANLLLEASSSVEAAKLSGLGTIKKGEMSGVLTIITDDAPDTLKSVVVEIHSPKTKTATTTLNIKVNAN